VSDPLAEALRIQLEAAKLGFDWRHLDELWDKLTEEVGELKLAAGEGVDRSEDELGDLLFMAVNLARHLHVDPVAAMRRVNAKFERRFAHILRHLDKVPPLGDPQRLERMEDLWQEAKRLEKKSGGEQ
jgi:uncharacterized protein YabN with tetrapyrrole methylase and pyrophosphatase domain